MSSIKKLDTIMKGQKSISIDAKKMINQPVGQVPSDVDLKSILREVILDEELRGYFGDIVDALIASGYTLIGDKKAVEKRTKQLKDIKFGAQYKQILWYGLTYQTVFAEIIKKLGGKLDRIKVLESSEMKPIINKFGKIKGWTQTASDGTTPKWNESGIAVMHIDQVHSGFWTIPVVRTLARLIRLKKYVLEHIEYLYKNNQFKTGLNYKNVSEDDIESLTDAIHEQVDSRNKLLITVSEEDMQRFVLSLPSDLQYHMKVLDMISAKMLKVIRVPPVIAGDVGGSNRSSSDVQARFAFSNRLKSFQKDLEDEINSELLPKMGITDVTIRHNTIDLKSDKEYIDMGTSLIQAGAKKDKVVLWINRKIGLDLPEDLFPTEDEEIKSEEKKQSIFGKMFNKDSSRVPKQNSNQFESRKPKEVDTSNIEIGSENHNDK